MAGKGAMGKQMKMVFMTGRQRQEYEI